MRHCLKNCLNLNYQILKFESYYPELKSLSKALKETKI